MKTAMQELFEKFGHLLPNIETEYLETEKQHIINSWENGYQHGSGVNIDKDKYHGIQYYTSTFETNKETLR